MIREQTVNTFENGIIMDLEPLKVPKSSLTNALNATLLTFNDNENSLQCDMGNGRVETAYLPSGYVPIGTTSLGGIIYIVSYNPIDKKCQIGSFPSPERNITSNELGESGLSLYNELFVDNNGDIIRTLYKGLLCNFTLNPGDKFLVQGSHDKNKDEYEHISYYDVNKKPDITKGWLTLELATLDSNGRLIYLKDLNKYDHPSNGRQYILKVKKDNSVNTPTQNVDDYRYIIGADYNIFNTKISGQLYLVAQLNVPDSFNVTYNIIDKVTYNEKDYYVTEIICTILPSDYPIHIKTEIEEFQDKNQKPYDELNIDGYKVKRDNNKIKITKIIPADTETSIKLTPILPFGRCRWLQTTLYIDASLINSGKMISDTWRYYKNETSMDINFSLDLYPYEGETIDEVKMVFIPYTKFYSGYQMPKPEELYKDNSYYSYILPKQKAYSGTHNVNIVFNNNFEENSLYLVKILIKKTGSNISYDPIEHWLYTSRVYNDKYLEYDEGTSSESNFDNLPFPLECEFTSATDAQYEINTNKTNIPNIVSDTKVTINSTGTSTVEGVIDLKARLSLKNDYNGSFGVENIALDTNNVSDKDFTIEISSETESEINDVNIDDAKIVNKSLTKEGNSFKFSVDVSSNIYASTVKKTIKAKNYFTPVASTTSEYLTYNVYFDDGRLYYMPTFFGLGMSSGGGDNEGGGGVQHIKGLIDLGLSSDTPAKLVQQSISLCEDTDNNPGYNKFPDNKLSTAIDQNMNSCPIVPVLLTYVGGQYIKYVLPKQTEEKYISYHDLKHNTGKRYEWFTDEQASSYRVIWFFMRTNSSNVTYAPINCGVYIYPIEQSTEQQTSYFESMHRWINVLSQLYVRKENQEELQKYSIEKINYNCNIKLNITSNIAIKIQGQQNSTSLTPTYYIKKNMEPSLNIMQSIFNANCVAIPPLNLATTTFNVNIEIPIENPLLELFQNAQLGVPIVDYYINNPFKDKQIKSIKSIATTNSQIYAIDFNSGELYIPTGSVTIKNIKKYAEGAIELDDTDDITLINPDLLYYNLREDKLLLNQAKYNTKPFITTRFQSGDGKFKSPTYVNSSVLIEQSKLFE